MKNTNYEIIGRLIAVDAAQVASGTLSATIPSDGRFESYPVQLRPDEEDVRIDLICPLRMCSGVEVARCRTLAQQTNAQLRRSGMRFEAQEDGGRLLLRASLWTHGLTADEGAFELCQRLGDMAETMARFEVNYLRLLFLPDPQDGPVAQEKPIPENEPEDAMSQADVPPADEEALIALEERWPQDDPVPQDDPDTDQLMLPLE